MHHAQLFLGSFSWARTVLPSSCLTPHEDVLHYSEERLGIDQVRRLVYEAHLAPFSGEVRMFVLVFRSITHEAQNALLKLLEEPPQTAQFFVVTSAHTELLPTLRSRLMLIATEDTAHDTTAKAVCDAFCGMSYAERLATIASRTTAKDDAWVDALMEGLEAYALEKKDAALMADMLMVRQYGASPGASKKMLLEHIALSLS